MLLLYHGLEFRVFHKTKPRAEYLSDVRKELEKRQMLVFFHNFFPVSFEGFLES